MKISARVPSTPSPMKTRISIFVAVTVAAAPAAADRWPPTADAQQLVLVTTPSFQATTGTLRRYHRGPDGGWSPIGPSIDVVVGKNGLAWGDPDAPRTLARGPEKREGDGRTPAGAFRLTAAYGVADAPPAGTRLPYHQSTAASRCVDDPRSSRYDQLLEETPAIKDWTSAEEMRRSDGLYDWVIVVDHNPLHSPGAGSCIFLHVWRTPTSPTVGCTAMAAPALAELMAWIDPERAVLVVLPERAAKKLKLVK